MSSTSVLLKLFINVTLLQDTGNYNEILAYDMNLHAMSKAIINSMPYK